MPALLVLAAYLAVGLLSARAALADHSPLLRGWIGLCFGLLLLMWLPALAAFFVGFTLLGEGMALGALALIAGGAVWHLRRHPRPARRLQAEDRPMVIALLCIALPLTLLSAYLQHTHTLREVDGALHVGQSTYGDLTMHLSIATGLRGQKLPADYSFFPGARLGYPLLTDAMSTSLLLFGMPLRWSLIIPGVLMSALVFAGFLLLAREMTGKTSAAVLAALFLFFNGGLGFLYDFDMAGSDGSRIAEIFTGYYKTPPNQPDINQRWSNLVVDLLLPQRTFLGGWTLLLPALYFARRAFAGGGLKPFLLAALFGAALPLVNTHAFLALGLYSAGALGYRLVVTRKERAALRALLIGAGAYLGIVVALALPQMLAFTMQQVSGGRFLRLWFNWVNNNGAGLIDFYPWFWLKNIGLPLLAMMFALLDFKKRDRMDLIGALCIFVVAELVLFQPLEYDNNKLFYVWYLITLPAAASWCISVYDRLRGRRSRVALAGLFVGASVLSGSLSMAREAISDYQLFSRADAAVAEYIEAETPPDAVFLTGLHHNNPVFALAGRQVVCGPTLFLHFHGLDYTARQNRVRMFYADPAENLDVLDAFGVDYILVGSSERYELAVDEEALAGLFEAVYDRDGVVVYATK
ncbi:MAG: hypothetical protein LBN04_09980 [Oscillospiraceae bacterium]|jgi:hypothetical protein|nr:hypothetical protein [Oscillospiraceae bacterium]